jgi:hypothetical protein
VFAAGAPPQVLREYAAVYIKIASVVFRVATHKAPE